MTLTLPNLISENLQLLPPEDTEDISELGEINTQKLESILEKISKAKARKVMLEGGHIYTDEKPNREHALNLKFTQLLKTILESRGHIVNTMLFIDDYHPKEHILDTRSYIHYAESFGIEFDQVVLESSLVGTAIQIRNALLSYGLASQTGNMSTLNQRRIHLTKEDGLPSCALLDATLSAMKLKQHDTGVTVLPGSYANQQRNMRTILRHVLKICGTSGEVHLFAPEIPNSKNHA